MCANLALALITIYNDSCDYGDGGDVEGYAKKVLWRCGEGCIIKNLARIGPDIVCYTCNLIANVADGDEYDML